MNLPFHPRRAILGLGLLLGACVASPPPTPPTPAGRYAALVIAADQTAGQVVDHLAARERAEVQEAGSLRFAAGAMPPTPPPPATPAAGAVLDPGVKLILMQAQRLAALSVGQVPAEGPQGAALLARVQDSLAALRAVPGRWPAETVRRRGLDAFAVLAAPAPPGLDAAGLALQRQRAVSEAVALLRAVIGDDARSGLRGALAQRHEAWRQAQTAMLNSVRNDRSIGPDQRMQIWQTTQARIAADPPEVAGAELHRRLGAIPAGHAAAGAGDAAGVEAFGAAVGRLQSLLVQAR
ncbi:hypothetical protein KPL78_04570 [Roseomonas sp. HJA6]|uniref:Uncharacterized protein n=1 Tax=Roseomonas alba TaxID=2846776 RepID=A0ABS7A490_9PROT|nr:hypothetical protein [Neoroseomonas alba]MBW6397108.1 hypothetical protein [Neoroseomonas alba]